MRRKASKLDVNDNEVGQRDERKIKKEKIRDYRKKVGAL